MADWRWVATEVGIAMHDEQLVRYGAAGVRDGSMLESAMARPLNLVDYGEPDVAELAASYARSALRAIIPLLTATSAPRHWLAACSSALMASS